MLGGMGSSPPPMSVTLPLPVQEQPSLEAPGAGLPNYEERLLRTLGAPLITRFLSRTHARRLFLREGERILYLLEDANDYRLDEPVLITRPMGIEDNSRCWSLSETAEHVMTVGNGIRQLLIQLAVGHRPTGKFDIKQVKPCGGLGKKTRQLLPQYLSAFTRDVDPLRFKNSPTFPHPWFGEMTAAQWHQYAALHHLMHRIQAQRIEEGLLYQL